VRRGGLWGRRRALRRSLGAAARASRRSLGRRCGHRGGLQGGGAGVNEIPGGTAQASGRARGGSVRASSREPGSAMDVVASSEDWGGDTDVNGSGSLGYRNKEILFVNRCGTHGTVEKPTG